MQEKKSCKFRVCLGNFRVEKRRVESKHAILCFCFTVRAMAGQRPEATQHTNNAIRRKTIFGFCFCITSKDKCYVLTGHRRVWWHIIFECNRHNDAGYLLSKVITWKLTENRLVNTIAIDTLNHIWHICTCQLLCGYFCI